MAKTPDLPLLRRLQDSSGSASPAGQDFVRDQPGHSFAADSRGPASPVSKHVADTPHFHTTEFPQHPLHPSLTSTPTDSHFQGHAPGNGAISDDSASKPMRTLYPYPVQPSIESRTPKKDIKRRTKTGCMTCRKRRIKCDEAQPTCGNCRKSKRECLGYDPVFKGSTTRASTAELPQQHVQLPPLGGYSQHPPHYDYRLQSHHSIDSDGQPVTVRRQELPSIEQSLSTPPLQWPTLAPINSFAPPDRHISAHPIPADSGTMLLSHRRYTRLTIDELVLADGIPPSALHVDDPPRQPHSPADLSAIYNLWRTQYATMLNTFFETTWYTTTGEAWLQSSRPLLSFFIYCNSVLKDRRRSGTQDLALASSLEASLVWRLASLVRLAWQQNRAADTRMADLLHRLDVVEHLVTGAILPAHLIPPPPASPVAPAAEASTPPDVVAHSFWHHLGSFCACDDTNEYYSSNATVVGHMQASMSAMRQILSVLEHRDVLYSVAVVRHFGGRLTAPDFERALAGNFQDPDDSTGKFSVALKFLGDEETEGTTAVARAIAGMGRRGLIRGRAYAARPLSQRH